MRLTLLFVKSMLCKTSVRPVQAVTEYRPVVRLKLTLKAYFSSFFYTVRPALFFPVGQDGQLLREYVCGYLCEFYVNRSNISTAAVIATTTNPAIIVRSPFCFCSASLFLIASPNITAPTSATNAPTCASRYGVWVNSFFFFDRNLIELKKT